MIPIFFFIKKQTTKERNRLASSRLSSFLFNFWIHNHTLTVYLQTLHLSFVSFMGCCLLSLLSSIVIVFCWFYTLCVDLSILRAMLNIVGCFHLFPFFVTFPLFLLFPHLRYNYQNLPLFKKSTMYHESGVLSVFFSLSASLLVFCFIVLCISCILVRTLHPEDLQIHLCPMGS